MPRGYRCVVIAFVGWLSLAAAQQPAKEQQSAGRTNQATDAQPTVPPPPPYAAHPDKYAEACYSAKNHDAADLCAQWRAALATEKAAREAGRATTWAIVAALLSAATVIGLIVTIWQTFGALNEARRGNLIAQRSNARATRRAVASAVETKRALEISDRQATASELAFSEASRTSRAQLRTYIASTGEPFTLDESGTQVAMPFHWQNVGRTPAHETVIKRRTFFQPSKPTEENKSRLLADAIIPFGTVGPNAHVETPHDFQLTREDGAAIVQGTGIIRSFVEIGYRDEFGDRWVYNHHLLVDHNSPGSGIQYTIKCETTAAQDESPELPLEDKPKRKPRRKKKAQ